jgi:HEAT repeat protein
MPLLLLLTGSLLLLALPLPAQEPPPEEDDPGIIIDPDALEPEGQEPPREQPGGPGETSLEAVNIELLGHYPDTAARALLDQLVARGSKSVPFLLTCLQDKALPVRLAAVEGLRRIADPGTFEAIAVAARDRKARARLPAFADAMIAIDREQGLAEVAGYLEHRRTTLRRHARESLRTHLTPEEATPLLEPYLTSEVGEAREYALDLLCSLQPGAFLSTCLAHLRDDHPGTAFLAATVLAEQGDERTLKQVHQLVLDGGYRSAAYATVTLVLAEDRTGERLFQSSAVDPILTSFRSTDQLDRGAAAIAMANLASWCEDQEFQKLLDRRTVPVLIETAGGTTYYPDHAVLRELVLKKLVYLTGKNFAFDWQAWRTWWLEERHRFQARRGLTADITVDPERCIVRWTSRGLHSGPVEVLIASYHDADFRGEMIQLSRDDMGALVQNLIYEGLLDLPETIGTEVTHAGSSTIALLSEGRTRAVTRLGTPRGPKAEIFDRLEAMLAQVRYENRWQRYHDTIAYPDHGEWWRTHYAWWRSGPSAEQASRRLRSMITRSIDLLPEERRSAALTDLGVVDGLCSTPVGASEALLLAEMIGGGDLQPDVAALLCRMIGAAADPGVVQVALRGIRLVQFYDHQRLAVALLRGLPEERIRALLTSPEDTVRAAAAEVLGGRQDLSTDTLELLGVRLQDEAPGVRAATAYALGQLGDESTIATLRPLLEDQVPFVRKGALRAIGELGGPRAVELLVPFANDPDRSIRQSALLALGASGDENAIYPLLGALLGETSPVGRQIAARALASFPGDAARRALLGRLSQEQDPEHRLHLVETLARMPSEEVRERLQAIVRDEEGEIREAAMLALGSLGDTSVVGQLIQLLRTGENPRALAALRRLTFQDLPAGPGVADAYSEWWHENQGRGWRWWLVEGLVSRGYPAVDLYRAIGGGERALEAIPPLIDALTEERPELRSGAARLLTELTGQDLGRPEDSAERLELAVLAARWRQWYEEHVRQQ